MNIHDYGSPKPTDSHTPQTSGSSDDDTVVAHKERAHTYPHDRHHDHDHDIPPNQHLDRMETYQTYDEGTGTVDNRKQIDQAKIDYEHHKHLWWYRIRYTLRDAFAEFCGTMIMIIFGDGSVAQVTLSANPNLPSSSQNKGEYQSISWGWGIGVMLGVYVCGCSGGHL